MTDDEWMSLPLAERRARVLNIGKAHKRRLKVSTKYQNARTRLVRTGGWDELFLKQGSCCAICRTTDPKHSYGWATDHCHSTGKIRGILCTKCNSGLGGFDDDIPRLEAALAYLRKPPTMW